MEWEMTREDYQNCQIAREGDDEGYGIFSGYVAVVKGNEAAIVNASHCSCYGTWDGDCLDYGNVIWTGTKEQLLVMASKKLDPAMSLRNINAEDFDYRYLSALYEAVLKWNEKDK